MPLTNRTIIKQSPALVNAGYSLTVVETDLIMKLISEIKNEDMEFWTFRFTIPELEKALGRNLDQPSLREIGRNLLKKPLTIDCANGDWFICNWISSFKYVKKSGTIEARFDPNLQPYLLEFKQFVKTELRYIFQLPSGYAKRIYTIMKQWEKIGKYEVDVAYWQKILEVPKSMLIYNRFKEKVIEPSKANINAMTDITVDYEEIKDGKKVVKLIWTIRTRSTAKQLTIDSVSTDEIDTRLPPEFIKRIVAKCEALMPLSEREITKLIKKEIFHHYQFEADKALVKSIKSHIKKGE
jgi:plasmid replication initiation protein